MPLITFRPTVGDDEPERPLLPDWVSPRELEAMLAKGQITAPSKLAAIDALYVRIGQALLAAVRARRVPAGERTGQESWVYSFARTLREWRAFATNPASAPIMDSELDVYRDRAIGWQQLLSSRGATVGTSLVSVQPEAAEDVEMSRSTATQFLWLSLAAAVAMSIRIFHGSARS
jgi:hypothetical protein